MDFNQIRFFLTLAEALNFTRAAEQCHVTQPALTKSIHRLEAELGGPLLLRERGYTQLTVLGQTMLPLLRQTFDAAELALVSAQRFQTQDLIRLRLGLGAHVEPTVLSPLIREIARRFPTLEVTVMQGSAPALSDRLLASRLDVVLTEDTARLTDRANRWQIYLDPVVAIYPDGHEIASADRLDTETLRGAGLVGRTGESDDNEADNTLEDVYALASSVRHRGKDEMQVCALVQAVHGVALSTERRVLPAGMCCRPVEPPHNVPIWVAALAGRPLSRAASAFLQLARARDWEA